MPAPFLTFGTTLAGWRSTSGHPSRPPQPDELVNVTDGAPLRLHHALDEPVEVARVEEIVGLAGGWQEVTADGPVQGDGCVHGRPD